MYQGQCKVSDLTRSITCISSSLPNRFIIPHTQHEQGKVMGVGVLYVGGPKKIESYFSDRLTFSNIHGRTSRRI